jgi:phosphoglucosamine mutase
MGKFFGTDGIRGEANRELTTEMAMKIGKAAALFTIKSTNRENPVFLIGKDTRISGDMLEGALTAGITSMGAHVIRAGVIPTPGVAYLTRSPNVDCGVVISASHNPAADNGIKFFSSEGFKFSETEEAEIERILESGEAEKATHPPGDRVGRVTVLHDAVQKYGSYVQGRAYTGLEGLSVVMDCANGAAAKIAPTIFSELGVQVVDVNNNPTGTNINFNCGSTHPELIRCIIQNNKYDAGLAFDGDGDRLIAIDEKGEIVDGDEMMNIFAHHYKKNNLLKKDIIVATVMSNIGLEKSLKEAGIQLHRTNVGDRHVLEEMRRTGALIGGEQSGHVIFLNDNTTGDGIITALHLLMIMKQTGKTLSQLKASMTKYPQTLKNIRITDKNKVLDNCEFLGYLKEKQEKTSDQYRLLIRASGTEPKIRVMAEGPDEKSTEELVDEVCREIEKYQER